MRNIEEYAVVTIDGLGECIRDIRVSRDIPIKYIIYNLLQALNMDIYSIRGAFTVKAVNKGIVLFQNDTLRQYGIFDGEILKIL